MSVGSAARPAIVEFQTVVYSFTFERQVPTLSLSVAIVVLSQFCDVHHTSDFVQLVVE